MPFDGLLGYTTNLPLNLELQALADLRAAQRLINKKSKWTKGFYNQKRWFTSSHRFCAMGAMREVAANDVAYAALRQALPPFQQRLSGCETVETYNDDVGTKHHNIMRLFAGAIARLGSSH